MPASTMFQSTGTPEHSSPTYPLNGIMDPMDPTLKTKCKYQKKEDEGDINEDGDASGDVNEANNIN